MSSMDANLKITERKLFTPTLEQIKDGMLLYFAYFFFVEVVQSPK